ncbi:MAG: hypothetical protein J0H49_02865 [Acidobacteria bacterium]|nr:hypothetical protein [Acidobacteriota bacterium]
MNALIVNCCGMGDGLIEAPFLKHLEAVLPGMRYFHTGGTLFSDEAFLRRLALTSCIGVVPAIWRKFYTQDWNQISTFMRANDVTHVINLRHIGPAYDTGYYAFRNAHRDSFSFFNFAFNDQEKELPNIRDKIDWLLRSAGVNDGCHNRQYLRMLVAPRQGVQECHIGINVHTGSRFKRWSRNKWHAFCRVVLKRGVRLTALLGHTVKERNFSEVLFREFRNEFPDTFAVVGSTDVSEVLEKVSGMTCMVSTDSWPAHAATGLGVNTIGLYIVTSAALWGGDPAHLFPVESRHLRRCENFEEVLGICRNRYVTCPLIEREGDGIEVCDVLTALEQCGGPACGEGAL